MIPTRRPEERQLLRAQYKSSRQANVENIKEMPKYLKCSPETGSDRGAHHQSMTAPLSSHPPRLLSHCHIPGQYSWRMLSICTDVVP